MNAPISRLSAKRTITFVVISVLVVLALAVSFYAGIRYAPTGPTPQEQAQAKVDVWGTIETRTVNSALSYSGIAYAGTTAPLSVPPSANPVLVHKTKNPGDTVAPGDLVGIIGGEGIYALEGPLPLYRALHEGDTGHDVQELQRAISSLGYRTNTDGTVTKATLNAVSALLRSELNGIPPEGIDSINPVNFAVLPSGPHTVATAADVGSTISETNPLLTLHTSTPYAEFKAPLKDIDALTALGTLTLTSSAGTTSATIENIGTLETGTDGAFHTVRVIPEDPAVLIPGQTLSVTTPGDDTPVLAVPVSAVRQDGTNTYITAQDDAGQQIRVPVQVLRTGEGYAAIAGNISNGQKVLLS